MAVDFDRQAYRLGPYGTNPLTPVYGKCTIDSARFSNDEVAEMGKCIYEAFDANIAAQTMWTFHNELEPRWSYLEAYKQGLIPSTKLESKEEKLDAV